MSRMTQEQVSREGAKVASSTACAVFAFFAPSRELIPAAEALRA